MLIDRLGTFLFSIVILALFFCAFNETSLSRAKADAAVKALYETKLRLAELEAKKPTPRKPRVIMGDPIVDGKVVRTSVLLARTCKSKKGQRGFDCKTTKP
jgi:hypothetical protein